MAKYSYIIPFYNVRPYTAACLDSVLAQTYSDWECVCVDDGSPDGLGEILDEYAAKDSRITVIHQANAGVGAARNAALEKITGDWFMFVDGDDLTAPRTCEFCEAVLKSYPDVDMLMFNETKFPQDGECNWGYQGVSGIEMKCRDVHDVVDSWTYSTGFCTRVFRKSVFGKYRFPSLVRGQDRFFLLDCVFNVNTIVQSNRPISGVRRRIGSTTRSSITAKKLEATIESARHMVNLVEASSRRVAPGLVRSQINRLVEMFIFEVQQLREKTERNRVMALWVDAVREISKSQILSGFQSFRMKVIGRFPVRPLIYLLCLLPYRIKSMGVHR